MKSIQLREEHWVIADLIGKPGDVRTVPIPGWLKSVVDAWTASAQIADGLPGRRQTLDEFLDDFPTVSKDAAVAALELAKTLLVGQLG